MGVVIRIVAWFAIMIVSLGSACTSGSQIRRDITDLDEELGALEAADARLCTPEELARAKAHREFAAHELSEHDYQDAQDHLDVAFENVERAKRLLQNCKVVERTPPPSPSP
ncbi:MAG: hypothetical protein D6795_21125, partial [Deltaproteobacteria bacterium]